MLTCCLLASFKSIILYLIHFRTCVLKVMTKLLEATEPENKELVLKKLLEATEPENEELVLKKLH